MDTLSIIRAIAPHQKNNMFKGVFPCDSLPNRFSLPAIFVVNLSPHTEPGSHWVSLYISSNGMAYYFDSFGMPLTNTYILRFLKRHSRQIMHNRKQIQHITSIKCGRFCCVFAVVVLKKCPIHYFMSKFSKNLFVNDLVIENMYNYLRINK